MRDSLFYFQLGFEHGYEGGEKSYPDDPNYARGYATGVSFAARVRGLVPTVRRDERGNLTVHFDYALRGVTLTEG